MAPRLENVLSHLLSAKPFPVQFARKGQADPAPEGGRLRPARYNLVSLKPLPKRRNASCRRIRVRFSLSFEQRQHTRSTQH